MITAGNGAYTPLIIAAGAVFVYGLSSALPERYRRYSGAISAVWLLAVFLIILNVIVRHENIAGESLIGLTGGLLITGIGAVAAYASQGTIDPAGPVRLYYPLFLLALAGAVAIGFARDLFTIFVAVELSAIPVYALCAYRYREEPEAIASATKYMIQGAAGTVTALLGVAILFLCAHTLDLAELPLALASADRAPVLLAAVLVILGYGVKLAIFPLHTWLPDAYARAPAGVTAIMAGATKIGVLIAMFLTLSALPPGQAVIGLLGIVIVVIAVITMTAGNILALNQRDLRYVLSYSSVAQMGYILLGFGIGMVYNLPFAYTAGLYYAIAYGLMKSGAFLAADAFAGKAGSSDVARMRGLGAKYPLIGISFAIFVFGLIGVPFTAGFLGKLLLEQAGMGTLTASGVALALILAVNSFVSLGYYVPVLSTLLFEREPGPGREAAAVARKVPGITPATLVTVVFLAAVTVYFGLFPESYGWISQAASEMFPWGVA